MENSELLAETSPIVRAIAPGITAALGTLLRSGQDRQNLEADHAVVNEMLQSGLTDFRYRGIAMEFEAFNEAQQEESKRLVANIVGAMSKADSTVDWSRVNLEDFKPEFRRRWIQEASNVSDDTLQDLWARLLAGELESPGSVSNDTMSIARDLNRQRATEFQTLCSATLCNPDGTPAIVVGCGNPGANTLEPFGLSYAVLMRLAHHRLIVNDMTSYITVRKEKSRVGVMVRLHDTSWLLRRTDDNIGTISELRINGLLLTPAGEELFKVVQKIPNPAYKRAAFETLKQEGWTVLSLSTDA